MLTIIHPVVKVVFMFPSLITEMDVVGTHVDAVSENASVNVFMAVCV